MRVGFAICWQIESSMWRRWGVTGGRGQGQSDYHSNPPKKNLQNPFYQHSISPLPHTLPARVIKPVEKVLLRDDRGAVKVGVRKEEWILWCLTRADGELSTPRPQWLNDWLTGSIWESMTCPRHGTDDSAMHSRPIYLTSLVTGEQSFIHMTVLCSSDSINFPWSDLLHHFNGCLNT